MRPSDRSRRASSASEAAGGARFALRVLCFHRDAKHAGRKVHATVCAAQHHDRKAGRLTAEQSDPCCKGTTYACGRKRFRDVYQASPSHTRQSLAKKETNSY